MTTPVYTAPTLATKQVVHSYHCEIELDKIITKATGSPDFKYFNVCESMDDLDDGCYVDRHGLGLGFKRDGGWFTVTVIDLGEYISEFAIVFSPIDNFKELNKLLGSFVKTENNISRLMKSRFHLLKQIGGPVGNERYRLTGGCITQSTFNSFVLVLRLPEISYYAKKEHVSEKYLAELHSESWSYQIENPALLLVSPFSDSQWLDFKAAKIFTIMSDEAYDKLKAKITQERALKTLESFLPVDYVNSDIVASLITGFIDPNEADKTTSPLTTIKGNTQ